MISFGFFSFSLTLVAFQFLPFRKLLNLKTVLCCMFSFCVWANPFFKQLMLKFCIIQRFLFKKNKITSTFPSLPIIITFSFSFTHVNNFNCNYPSRDSNHHRRGGAWDLRLLSFCQFHNENYFFSKKIKCIFRLQWVIFVLTIIFKFKFGNVLT